jgi:hypothetical protein
MDDLDAEVAQTAVRALSRFGSPDAEKVLWARLERLHQEADTQTSARPRADEAEQNLVFAIAKAANWSCPPEKLARLAELVTPNRKRMIDDWIAGWKSSAKILPAWYPSGTTTFAVLQYDGLTEEQLRNKLAQFPRGTELRWQFWPPGEVSPPVSMEIQEAVYERIRTDAAGHGVVIGKASRQIPEK